MSEHEETAVDLDALLGDAPAEDLQHDVLSPDQVKKALADARAKVDKARTAEAMKAVMDKEILRLEREEGLVTGSEIKDQMVKITLDLAPYQKCLTVNFNEYHHNHTYTVQRHVADSLREMQANGWRHEAIVQGKSMADYYQRAEEASISGVTGIQSRFNDLRNRRKAA